MPLLEPIEYDEATMLTALTRAAVANARATCTGLSGEQLRSRPVPSSELSLAWLLLHMGDLVDEWTLRIDRAPATLEGATSFEQMMAKSAERTSVGTEESAEQILQRFDEYVESGLERLERGFDPGRSVPVPDQPWFPPGTNDLNARWVVHHVLGELSRHSGHADLLREALDGTTMYEGIAAAEGLDLSYIDEWFERRGGAGK